MAARGLDIPNVDWVVQYDPPQDPAAFVHRCGRTARLGRDGKALVFLSAAEDTYINFLEIRKIPIQALASPPQPIPTVAAVRKLAANDREVYEKSRLAFVSFVRGYKEHQLTYIFRTKDINYGQLAMGFGLLDLPKMPELKDAKNSKDFTPSEVNTREIRYLDKQKERHRQIKIAELAANPVERKAKKEKTEPWSKQKDQKARKEKRKAGKAFKRTQAAAGGGSSGGGAGGEGGGGASDDEEWDLDDLAKEARLAKKLKQGKITKAEYQKHLLEGLDF